MCFRGEMGRPHEKCGFVVGKKYFLVMCHHHMHPITIHICFCSLALRSVAIDVLFLQTPYTWDGDLRLSLKQ